MADEMLDSQVLPALKALGEMIYDRAPEKGVETILYLQTEPPEVQALRGGDSLEFSNPYQIILNHEDRHLSVFRPGDDHSIITIESDGRSFMDGMSTDDLDFLKVQLPPAIASQSTVQNQKPQESLVMPVTDTEVQVLPLELASQSTVQNQKPQESLVMSVTDTEVQVPQVEATPVATAAVEPAAPDKQQSVDLKPFKGGATIFGEAAIQAAELAGMDADAVHKTRSGEPYIKVSDEQVPAITAGLEAQGVTVNVKETPQNAFINVNETHGVGFIYGKAAIAAAEYLEVPTEITDKGNPKLRLDLEQVDEVTDYLKEKGFKVEVSQFESTQKPKALFREHPDGERYFVYDASAKNVAKALGIEVEHTPGGRPSLEFDRASYRQLKTDLANDLDISTKDLKLEVRLSTFENNGKAGAKAGAVIVGEAAKEVAAALELKAGWTKPSAKTGKPLPKVVLKDEQVEAAQEYLEEQGYTVQMEAMPDLGKTAMIKTHDNGGIVFGEAAEVVAEAMERPLGEASSGNPMLKLNRAQLAEARDVLESEGFAIKEERLAPQQQQGEGQAQGGSATPMAKGVEQNGDGQATPAASTKAVITTLVEAGTDKIIVFGEAAQVVADTLGVDMQTSQKGKSYVKAPGEKLPEVKAALQEAGFAVSTQPFQQPQKAAPAKPVSKAKGDDGR